MHRLLNNVERAKHLERVLAHRRRMSIDELLQFAEVLFDYALTIQAHEKWTGPPPPYVIVEVSELAVRFGKTPLDIGDALLLLRAMGCAELLDTHGHWKMYLSGFQFREDARGA